MFCKKCGSKLAEDAEFCHKCGTKVENPADETEKEEQSEPEETMNDSDESSAEVSESYDTAPEMLDGKQRMKSEIRKHWKVLLVLGVVVFVFIIVLIASAADSGGNSYSDSYDDYEYTESGFSESTLESLAAMALSTELYNHKSMGMSLSTWYDIGATRYSIGSIVEDDGVWIIRGTFSLYDYYGKIASNYYNETFTVRVTESGSTSCTTSL